MAFKMLHNCHKGNDQKKKEQGADTTRKKRPNPPALQTEVPQKFLAGCSFPHHLLTISDWSVILREAEKWQQAPRPLHKETEGIRWLTVKIHPGSSLRQSMAELMLRASFCPDGIPGFWVTACVCSSSFLFLEKTTERMVTPGRGLPQATIGPLPLREK